MLEPQLKKVREAPTFEEAHDAYWDLREGVFAALDPLEKERAPFVAAYEQEIDGVFAAGQERAKAVDLMSRVLGRVAFAASRLQPMGADLTDDASRLFVEDGIDLLGSFMKRVKELQRLDEPRAQTVEGRCRAAHQAAEELESRPDEFGTYTGGHSGGQEQLAELAYCLSIYGIAEFCAEHGRIDVIENPAVAPWIARRYGAPAVADGELIPGDPSIPVSLPTIVANELHFSLALIDELCRPEAPLNDADKIVRAVMFSVAAYGKDPHWRVTNQQWQAAAREVRGEFVRIIDGSFRERSEAFDHYLVYVVHHLNLKMMIEEDVYRECGKILERYQAELAPLDARLENLTRHDLQPLLDEGFQQLLSHPLPWEENPKVSHATREALQQFWAKHIASRFNFTRLLQDEKDGTFRWASDLQAAEEHVPGLKERNAKAIRPSAHAADFSEQSAPREEHAGRPEQFERRRPIPLCIGDLFGEAITAGASEIHLRLGSEGVEVFFRVGGEFHQNEIVPLALRKAVSMSILLRAGLDITGKEEQRGFFNLVLGGQRYRVEVVANPEGKSGEILIAFTGGRG